MYAVAYNNTEMVQVLLAYGADVNAQNNKGYTALMWVKKQGHKEIVRILKEAGAKE